jgi:hypothetical protein
MSTYDELLNEARAKAQVLVLSAREYIPKMYKALRAEVSNMSPDDARDRIQKDCVGIWSRRTILNALPSEAKDPKKQKAGRLSRKEHSFAAFYAAPETHKAKKEIEINTQGKCITNVPYQTTNNSKSTLNEKGQHSVQLQDCDNLAFEFSLPRHHVWGQLIDDLGEEEDSKENPVWFSGIIDRYSGRVISTAIGRRTTTEQAAP